MPLFGQAACSEKSRFMLPVASRIRSIFVKIRSILLKIELILVAETEGSHPGSIVALQELRTQFEFAPELRHLLFDS